MEGELDNIRKVNDVAKALGSRMDSLKKDIDTVKDQSEKSQGQKTLYTEMFRKVQEHDRELKRMRETVKDIVSPDRINQIETRLNYSVSEDFMFETQTKLKQALIEEIKKAIDLTVSLDCSVQLGFVSKDEFSNKMQEVEDKFA